MFVFLRNQYSLSIAAYSEIWKVTSLLLSGSIIAHQQNFRIDFTEQLQKENFDTPQMEICLQIGVLLRKIVKNLTFLHYLALHYPNAERFHPKRAGMRNVNPSANALTLISGNYLDCFA